MNSLTNILSLLVDLPSDLLVPSDMVLEVYSSSEWERSIEVAYKEGLAPLLYWVLSSSGQLSSIPEKIINDLRSSYGIT